MGTQHWRGRQREAAGTRSTLSTVPGELPLPLLPCRSPRCHPWAGAPPHPIPLPVSPASAPAAEPGFLHRQGLLDFSLLCCEITIN